MKVSIEIDMPERSTLTGGAIAAAVRQAVQRDFADVDLADKRVGANEGRIMSPNGHTVGTWAVREAPGATVGPHYIVPPGICDFAYAGLKRDRYRVTAIFTSDDAANQHLETHPGEGVIANLGEFVIVAEHAETKVHDPVLAALRAAWAMLHRSEVRHFIRDGEGEHLGEGAQYDASLRLARLAGMTE